MILAGDIGGTNTRIALFEQEAGLPRLTLESIYPSREYAGLEEIVSAFLSTQKVQVEAACFGIAGPIVGGKALVSNLPWIVDSQSMARLLRLDSCGLINDLVAHAYGIDALQPADLIGLNSVVAGQGNGALIAAGTGLGEAGLYWDGALRHPFPCEGGHADFAPRNDVEVALYQYLAKKYGHVSYERVLSGPGLVNVFEFLRDSGSEQEPTWLQDELHQNVDQAAVISQHAMDGNAAICMRSMEIFVEIYGAEAGNLALRLLASGGVYVSGGIAGKILPKLTDGRFMQAFSAKGRMKTLLEETPVKVIVNDKVGLIGAARCALLRLALAGTAAVARG